MVGGESAGKPVDDRHSLSVVIMRASVKCARLGHWVGAYRTSACASRYIGPRTVCWVVVCCMLLF